MRRGRPPSPSPKQLVSLRLDREIVTYFKIDGPGWQTRINDVLRKKAKPKTRQIGPIIKRATRAKAKGKPFTKAAHKAKAIAVAIAKRRPGRQPAKRAAAKKRA